MNLDAMLVFGNAPETMALYQEAEDFLFSLFPAARSKGSKTQISFSGRYGFAVLSPATRKWKGYPEALILLTFGLGHRVEHPRIAVSVEPYPGRWTHHVPISRPEELDEQVEKWLREAYAFSETKGRRR